MSTRIIEEQGTQLAAALEELLAGLAHGDNDRIVQAFQSLGTITDTSNLEPHAQELLKAFHSTVWQLRSDFDPSSVTMSSTNIPDAVNKLESVLTDTAFAANSVFTLLNRQEELLKRGEAKLQELETRALHTTLSASDIHEFVASYRGLNKDLIGLSTQIVTTQEYQDLCGQRIQKVLKLIKEMESSLTSLLQQMKISLPATPEVIPEGEQKVEQDSVDDILKGFGI
jgi:chemotaxis protein CheZ